MKAIEPALAFALLFAASAIVTITIGQHNQNPYFVVAAAAFALATYVTYPPAWAVELAKYLPGRNNERK